MKHQVFANDSQALAFVAGQAYEINSQVIAQPYPDWTFNELIFVDTTGNPWSPGIMTYTSDMTGAAKWQSGHAKDIPLADVSQDMQMKTHHMGAIGYQWNLEEVNAAGSVIGGTLSNRRAFAARAAYQYFMWNLTWFGDTEKGLAGLANYPGVPKAAAASDGTGDVPYWVNAAGVGVKTPAQILRDINRALLGVSMATFGTILADTVLMPEEAYEYIAATPYSPYTTETILSFVLRTNLYTTRTGRPIVIRSRKELGEMGTEGAGAGKGRLVAYQNNPTYVKLHLPMPHNFLPVWQDGPMNYMIPGIFRTGGVEMLIPQAAFYLDGISETPVP